MQVNSIRSYSAPHVAFGNEGEATEKKQINKKALIAAGAAAAAVVAGGIYSVKRGKKINTAGLSEELIKQQDNLKGLKGLWNNLKTGVQSIFTKTGRKEYRYSKNLAKATEVFDAACENKLTQEMTERLTQNAAKRDAVYQIKNGKVTLTSIYDDAGNKLTGEALENAKKLRKEEFAKAVEEAKKTVTEEDIFNQAKKEMYIHDGRLNDFRDAKFILDVIKKGNISEQKMKDAISKTPLANKTIKDGKIDIEALKSLLEKFI